MTHVTLVKTKTVGNGDLRDWARNEAAEKTADKIKLTQLVRVEAKEVKNNAVGDSDLRDRARNGAVAPRLMVLAEPGLFYRRMQGAEWGAWLQRSDLGFAAGFLG